VTRERFVELAKLEEQYGCGVGGGLVDDVRKATARRCAEIAEEARTLPRAERRYHAHHNDVPGLLECAYREVAHQIRREFGLEDSDA
jgi:hypothetical protein